MEQSYFSSLGRDENRRIKDILFRGKQTSRLNTKGREGKSKFQPIENLGKISGS